MNFDDLLQDAWQGETRAANSPDMIRRVRRKRRLRRLLRAVEVLLTLLAVLVFGHALATAGMTPTHWLLMPFYVVFLPIAWAIALRAPRRHSADATERVCIYAHLRLSQLRTGLRDLWLARATAWLLLAYALAANLTAWLMANALWRSDALLLLVVAMLWLGGTLLLSAMLRRRWLWEYRAVRRLASR